MTQPHNLAAAEAWGHAGAGYDFISFGLSDGLSHAVQRLWPKPGEKILDVATGTGWTARLVAQQGASVTAIDIADGLLEAACELSSHLPITYRHADAELLPFENGGFDGVISTYGVMFAGDQQAAAWELARVVRPGGRMVLTTWFADPESYIPAFFAMVGRYSGAPAPQQSPMNWGNRDWIEDTFGETFDIRAEKVTTTLYAPDADTLWIKYINGFGPMNLTADALDAAQLEAFRQEFRDLHAPYDTGHGLKIDRDALLVSGVRKG
jgi:SAM-dependent methyltransferase